MALRIEILPPWWSTRPFPGAVAALLFLIAWTVYRQRVHQVAQGFEERLAERTRIARELHDTLVQSFHGLMVQKRRFRADLYYRLNVYPIFLPPLRERQEDIPPLVEHFVQEFARRQGKSIDCIPASVLETLKNHPWHGNIRELQNCIERAVIRTKGTVLQLSTAELMRDELESENARTLADVQRAHIKRVLHDVHGVVGGPQGAAAQLGLPRSTLLARMKKLGIVRPAPDVANPEQGVFFSDPDTGFSDPAGIPADKGMYRYTSPAA